MLRLIIAIPLIFMTLTSAMAETPCRTNHRGQTVCKDSAGDQWTNRQNHRGQQIWVNQRTHMRVREKANNNRGMDLINSTGKTVVHSTPRSGDRTRIVYNGGNSVMVCRPDPVRLIRCFKE
jgi:hypothetical protein